VTLIFVETSQQRGLSLSGLYLASFDEQDQFGLPVLPGALLLDPNAATVFARFRHCRNSLVRRRKNSAYGIALKPNSRARRLKSTRGDNNNYR